MLKVLLVTSCDQFDAVQCDLRREDLMAAHALKYLEAYDHACGT